MEVDLLLVDLESFSARVTRRGVLLTWTTSSEFDNVWFRILRGRPVAGSGSKRTPPDVVDLAPITPQLIPAQGSELAGSDYRYVDRSVQPPGTVHYYLEDVDTNGRTTRHGPVVVEIPQKRPRRSKR